MLAYLDLTPTFSSVVLLWSGWVRRYVSLLITFTHVSSLRRDHTWIPCPICSRVYHLRTTQERRQDHGPACSAHERGTVIPAFVRHRSHPALVFRFCKAFGNAFRAIICLELTDDCLRLIKCFSWEDFYAQQVAILRAREMKTVQKLSLALAAMIASITFLPILATILSFITYSLTGHDLDVAIIFTALQFFNLLRSSLLFLPIVMSTLADAAVALARSKFLSWPWFLLA
jgi:hypothetical protein